MTDTNSLLRDYAKAGSETAFRQLVTQYIDLVYSTALRRMSGDTHSAEDVVQTVFTDLARKASSLPENVMLGGWLHKHSCFVASNFRRTETRRLAREKEAAAMEHGSEEANWSEIEPALDDAIEQLDHEDRDAIVLRFFEHRDFRAIGEAIGSSENAAQKRVARALEKLRTLLVQRGVALSAAGLLAALTSHSIIAAPASLARKATDSALAKTAAPAGVAVGLWTIALCLGLALVGTISFTLVKAFSKTVLSAETRRASPTEGAASSELYRDLFQPLAVKNSTAASTTATAAAAPVDGFSLRLLIVADDSGIAIPNVLIEYRAFQNKKWAGKNMTANRDGACLIPYTTTTSKLELFTRVEGFADTRLHWNTQGGDHVPSDYTLRLKRGVRIGGKVVNAAGQLVQNATVGLSLISSAEELMKRESHEFDGILLKAEDGSWETARVAESVLRRIFGSATHPDYSSGAGLAPNFPNDQLEALLKRNFTFVLGDTATVHGVVVNEADQPVSGAKVLVGLFATTGSLETVSNGDGAFEVSGCAPGKTALTASANGYAATTISINTTNDALHRIVLKPGRLLKARVINRSGEPIAGARFWYDFIPDDREFTRAQVEFTVVSDAQGLITWTEAPHENISFQVYARGHMRRSVEVVADGVEHDVTLDPALRVKGAVKDAETGQLIPQFRLVVGWPSFQSLFGQVTNEKYWSSLDRHWIRCANGRFDEAFEEVFDGSSPEKSFVFKIDAENYMPLVSRVVRTEEESVELEFLLRKVADSKLAIRTPDDKPATATDVCFLRQRGGVILNGPSLSRNTAVGVIYSVTDESGQTPWQKDEFFRIVAAGPSGFATALVADLAKTHTLQLEPWGSIEGRVTVYGKPPTNSYVLFSSHHEKNPFLFPMGLSAPLDDAGHFTLKFIPAKEYRAALTGPVAAGLGREIIVEPGKTTLLNRDVSGSSVKVRLGWPAGSGPGTNQNIFVHVAKWIPRPTPEILSNPETTAAWQSRPDVAEAIAEMRRFPFRLIEPGVFKCDAIPPGEWTLAITIMPIQGPPPVLPVWTAEQKFKINDEVGMIDLGSVMLKQAQ